MLIKHIFICAILRFYQFIKNSYYIIPTNIQLIPYLTTQDNHINELQFYVSSSIDLEYDLYSECYDYDSKNKGNFSINIELFYHSLNLTSTHTLTISIIDNKNEVNAVDITSTTISKICKFEQTDNCDIYYGQQLSIFPENEGDITISLLSNMIDLAIVNVSNQFEVVDAKTKLKTTNTTDWIMMGVIIGAILLLLLIIGIVIYFYYKSKEIYISNVLVVLIGIGYYDAEPEEPEFDSVEMKDLDGVESDMKILADLFRDTFNYTVVGDKNDNGQIKCHRTQKEVNELLKYSAELFISETSTFDAMMVVTSGHGWAGSIVTSDWKLMEKDALHRYYSVKYPQMREYPRIFMYDCCDGVAERERRESDDDDDEESVEEKKTDQAKGLKLTDIQKDKEYDLWHDDGVNPDFRLVEIHAANKSFQSKMDSEKGSYMICKFVEQMQQYLGKKTLSKMCDSIQHDLHERGKQHTTNIFNDGCGYLKFKKNDITTDVYESGHETELVKIASSTPGIDSNGSVNTTPN